MESEIEQRWKNIGQEKQVHFLQELMERHPALMVEIEEMLDQYEENARQEEGFDANELKLKLSGIHTSRPTDQTNEQQRLDADSTPLNEEAAMQAIFDDLIGLLQEAQENFNHQIYQPALDAWTLVLDGYLKTRDSALIIIYERSISEFISMLSTLLIEVSSVIEFDASREHTTTLLPLLTQEKRQQWLERLFRLWLKRMETHSREDELRELMLEIAWNEDKELLRHLIQKEHQQQCHKEPGKIVDFSQQARIRMLEKFLKELS